MTRWILQPRITRQGAEKTDGNSQEQAAVLCHLPFAFGRSTRSSRNSSGPLVSRVGALLGRGDFLLQIIIFDRLSVVFEKLQIRKIRARPKRPPADFRTPASARSNLHSVRQPSYSTSRAFLHWRLSDDGPSASRIVPIGRRPKPFTNPDIAALEGKPPRRGNSKLDDRKSGDLRWLRLSTISQEADAIEVDAFSCLIWLKFFKKQES
jgi:hypothetical protein